MEEQSKWPAHAAFMDARVDEGFVVLGGPLADEERVVLAVEAESKDAVRATLARDPWSETHLRVDAIERWTIRLDGRRTQAEAPRESITRDTPPVVMSVGNASRHRPVS
jgi:uncharacterized protein YciI